LRPHVPSVLLPEWVYSHDPLDLAKHEVADLNDLLKK
jgi:hypothetical protein